MDPAFTFAVDDQDDAEEAFYAEQCKRYYLPRERLKQLAATCKPPQSWYEEDDFS